MTLGAVEYFHLVGFSSSGVRIKLNIFNAHNTTITPHVLYMSRKVRRISRKNSILLILKIMAIGEITFLLIDWFLIVDLMEALISLGMTGLPSLTTSSPCCLNISQNNPCAMDDLINNMHQYFPHLKRKNSLNCLHLTCSMLQPSYPNFISWLNHYGRKMGATLKALYEFLHFNCKHQKSQSLIRHRANQNLSPNQPLKTGLPCPTFQTASPYLGHGSLDDTIQSQYSSTIYDINYADFLANFETVYDHITHSGSAGLHEALSRNGLSKSGLKYPFLQAWNYLSDMHADNPAAFEFSLVNIGSEFNLIASDQTGAEADQLLLALVIMMIQLWIKLNCSFAGVANDGKSTSRYFLGEQVDCQLRNLKLRWTKVNKGKYHQGFSNFHWQWRKCGWGISFGFGGSSGHQRRIRGTRVVLEGASGGKMGRRSAEGVRRLHSGGPEERGGCRGGQIGVVLQGVEIIGDSGERGGAVGRGRVLGGEMWEFWGICYGQG
ncbi:hypothetical protein VP01_564g2 [Puccinia sorghi]|uniref:Uncharacterized protein n=1 Tax=Puccinia sorghi TaxID=27349 RepID=A0A0L6UIY6_9BASI|nr:hypothetical protein VP01_564g2 [Puccinia sorghi]